MMWILIGCHSATVRFWHPGILRIRAAVYAVAMKAQGNRGGVALVGGHADVKSQKHEVAVDVSCCCARSPVSAGKLLRRLKLPWSLGYVGVSVHVSKDMVVGIGNAGQREQVSRDARDEGRFCVKFSRRMDGQVVQRRRR